MVKEIARHLKRRFYDSHPNLPLDPDNDQPRAARPIHTDAAHVAVVAIGAYFGTLARYEIGLRFPAGQDGWPIAILVINVAGAFMLGVLLQALLHHGKDAGGRRILRLLIGTGFLGAFTTYSSLATAVALLIHTHHLVAAVAYAAVSVVAGALAGALGIWIATTDHRRRRGV